MRKIEIEKMIIFAGAVLMAMAIGGLVLWLRWADAQEYAENARIGRTGPDQAKKWADKFGADGPIDCVREQWIYRCTVLKNGTPIALECWRDGCAIQGPAR